MALIKLKKFSNGASGDYWRPYQINWIDGVCHIAMACYLNKVTRKADPLAILATEIFTYDSGFDAAAMDIKNPIKITYEKTKESKKVKKIITIEQPEVKDVDGNIITPAVPEVSEMVETNWFINAVDEI